MTAYQISRARFLVGLAGTVGLTAVGAFEKVTLTYAGELTPGKEYVAVYTKSNPKAAFAVLEKPKGMAIGRGTNVEIDAFGLKYQEVDYDTAKTLAQKLVELDSAESRKLPDGFKVFGDKRHVEPTYAAGSKKFMIKFIDPSDVSGYGMGGGSGGGGM